MENLWMQFIEHMTDRVTGPMRFRFLLQPVMATIFAVIAGLKDAKTGKTPYFWGLLSDSAHRVDMIKDGWKSVGKVFILAVVLDLVFQALFLKTFLPIETILIAFVLAIVPYLAIRGLVTRIARK